MAAEPPSPGVLVLFLTHSCLAFVAWVAILVFAIVRWRDVAGYLRQGAVVSLGLFVLALPQWALFGLFFDLSSLLPPELREHAPPFKALAFGAGILLSLVGLAHAALQVGVASLANRDARPFPFLAGQPSRFAGWPLAVALGVASAVASTLTFHYLHVETGNMARAALRMYPGLAQWPPAWVAVASLPTLLSAAIAEELLYRGVLQGWLTRWFGGTRTGVVMAVALTSAFWSLAHAPNAVPLAAKLLQVFLLGLLFGWLAHRRSVEASCVAHLCLNASVVPLSLALPG